MYKKNPSTPDLHINCNLTSDNMPKIHPETQVLIIKRLKTRSTAEVADTINVSQTRLEKSKPAPFPLQQSSTRPGHLKSPCQPEQFCRILSRNGLHGPISAQKPALNNKTRPTACQKDGRWKSGRRWISQMNVLLNYITVAANIAGDLLEPAWIRDSPRKQSSLVAEKSWSGVTSSMVVCERSAGWKATSISLKYQEVLAASYIPNHKRGHILQQDDAPSHTSISTSKFLKAKKIKVLNDWPA